MKRFHALVCECKEDLDATIVSLSNHMIRKHNVERADALIWAKRTLKNWRQDIRAERGTKQ